MLGDEGPDLDQGEDVLDGPGVGGAAVGGRHGECCVRCLEAAFRRASRLVSTRTVLNPSRELASFFAFGPKTVKMTKVVVVALVFICHIINVVLSIDRLRLSENLEQIYPLALQQS